MVLPKVQGMKNGEQQTNNLLVTTLSQTTLSFASFSPNYLKCATRGSISQYKINEITNA